MTHYVCLHCEKVGEMPGVCQTPDCPSNGDILEECSCDDERHSDLKLKAKEIEDDLD